jgi:hypothetical protein
MAQDDNGVEKFALGIIVAVIVFLFLRREFGRHGATANGSIFSTGVNSGHTGNTRSGCGCDTGSDSQQVIPIGGQSYNNPGSSYENNTVISGVGKVVASVSPAGPSHQWYAGPAPASSEILFGGGSGSIWLS